MQLPTQQHKCLKKQAPCAHPNCCSYNFVSTAVSEFGEQSKQALVGQVTTPGAIP